MILITILIISALAPTAALGSELDLGLAKVIDRLKLEPLPEVVPEPQAMLRLGHRLFHDPILSGNRDIACIHCHHPRFASGDGLPFSIGTGGKGLGTARQQENARITPRSSPAIFNLHVSDELPMFWDGRVSFYKPTHTFRTPEPAIKEGHPFTKVLDGSLAAQAMFPVVSHDEMRGQPGENEIADARDNFEAWARLMARLGAIPEYRAMFAEAFPSVEGWENFTFAHAARAIAAFERLRFQATQTPFDRYLGGELTAMTDGQKRGALIFYGGKGRCFTCHVGSTLGGVAFFSIGIPQTGNAASHAKDDLGVYAVSPIQDNEGFRYSFKAPMLRNVALTAPYMHDGALPTLRDVITHYTAPERSLAGYAHEPDGYKANYSEPILHDTDAERVRMRVERINGVIAGGLQLSEQNQADLLDFLENGLTDPRWKF